MKTLLDLKPSHFTVQPWNSIRPKCETEIVARNTMVIRQRLGDKWKLSWKDYKRERIKDGSFSYGEQSHFEDVMALTPDAEGAMKFSPDWLNAGLEAMKN